MSSIILELRNVSKTYKSSGQTKHALRSVNLDIYEGEVLALLGVNGAGKSTLSSLLATLNPPTSGDIFYRGSSIYQNLVEYRQALGFCPQRPNLDPQLNVEQNLQFAGYYFLISSSEANARAERLLQKFHLETYANSNINQLSGGMKQRLSIARSLMHNPKILILDEPTVGLDPHIRRELWDAIKELKKLGITIILTTHYLDEAEVLADRACLLQGGQAVLTASIGQIKEAHKNSTFEEIFLEFVQTKS